MYNLNMEEAKPSLNSQWWVGYSQQQGLLYKGWRGPRDSATDSIISKEI